MEEVRICDYCGMELAEDEGTYVDEELLCEDCVADHCITCDHCGETIWTADCVTDDNSFLCQSCFDAHYHRCESCDRIISDDDCCWHDDLPYCESCFEDLEDEIEDYSCKPTPIFYGDGKRYFGVELEVDDGGKDNDNAYRLKSIGNAQLETIYIKSDGSLDDGFEIVSHPMTLDYHTEEMNWKIFFERRFPWVIVPIRPALVVCTFMSTGMLSEITRQNKKMSSAGFCSLWKNTGTNCSHSVDAAVTT